MDTLLRDIRYAVRSLLRSPGLTLAALATLALGIGANTALFSLVNGALWSPPPGVRDADRLVWASNLLRQFGGRPMGVAYPDYRDYRDRSGAFRELAAFRGVSVSLGSGGEPTRLDAELVTGNYFAVLRMRPALGRGFLAPEDAAPGTHPVTIISHALWRRRFGGDSAVVGRPVVVNGAPLTVVGVAPPGFRGLSDIEEPADLWIPTTMYRVALPQAPTDDLEGRWGGGFGAVGRLRPGVPLEQARAAVRGIAAQLAAAHPGVYDGMSADVFPFRGMLGPGKGRSTIPVLGLAAGVTTVVLLIACGNVANLLLARAAGRRREITVRAAIGASRGRIVRQLLAESLALSLAGGAVGALLAALMVALFTALAPVPFPIPAALDGRALVATLALSLLTGVAFGLAPALRASRPELATALRGDAGGARGRAGLQRALVGGQVALSCILLVGAGLLLRSLQDSLRADRATRARDAVVTLSFDLGMQGYAAPRREAFHQEILARAGALPGVAAASLATRDPFRPATYSLPVAVERTAGSTRPGPPESVLLNQVWPGFFRTLEVPLARGREFGPGDHAGGPGVAVVNEAAVRRYWPGEDPLGKRIRLGPDTAAWLTVVGVTKGGVQDTWGDTPYPAIYRAAAQGPAGAEGTTLLVRTRGPAAAVRGSLREQIRTLDPRLPVFDVRTLAQAVDERRIPQRIGSALLAVFGALALGLAAVGVYGVTAFAVAQRTREVGVRVALGATRPAVVGLFARDALRVTAAGAGVGSVLAVAAAQALSRVVHGVRAVDAVAFAGVALLLAAATLAASSLAARRAARVDPMVALRAE